MKRSFREELPTPTKRGVSVDLYPLYRTNNEEQNNEQSVMICRIFDLIEGNEKLLS